MRITEHKEVILDEQDIFDGLYSGKITSLDSVNAGDDKTVEQFNKARQTNADPFPNITHFEETVKSIEDFDRDNQQEWYMGDYYKEMDIAQWLIERCATDEELNRVAMELELFAQHSMFDVLKYLKYLVDTMRYNNIIWGVGRGSSVASYCLYLIGVHKINSIKYELDIHEFLKGESK
jgi:DNA polymerase III alpha subunit